MVVIHHKIKKNINFETKEEIKEEKKDDIKEEKRELKKEKQEVKITQLFNTSPKTIYDAFTDSKRISAYTNAKADIDLKDGGKFEFLNGYMFGQVVSHEEDSQLILKLSLKDWKKRRYVTC